MGPSTGERGQVESRGSSGTVYSEAPTGGGKVLYPVGSTVTVGPVIVHRTVKIVTSSPSLRVRSPDKVTYLHYTAPVENVNQLPNRYTPSEETGRQIPNYWILLSTLGF